MRSTIHSAAIRYGIAILAVGVIVLLKKLLSPLAGEDSPFLLLFVSVMVSSWLGGFGPGLLATVLATVASDLYFLTPGEAFLQNPLDENFRLGLFFLEGTLLSWGVAALNRMQKALKEANRRKDDFLAMLAHELRNPLAAICTSLELLRLGRDEGDLMEAVGVIDRQASQMNRLVGDLLDVSRIAQGKVKLRREQVNVSSIVAQATAACRPFIDARRHELIVSLPPEPVWIDADPVRIEQILINLLNNAVKYTDEGGSISLDVTRELDQVVLRVCDTGIGIPQTMLPRVFNLYTQTDACLDRSHGGLGIGLTLVRKLVEIHKGSVEAFSAGPGRGSEFVVRLPVLPESAIDVRGRSSPPVVKVGANIGSPSASHSKYGN